MLGRAMNFKEWEELDDSRVPIITVVLPQGVLQPLPWDVIAAHNRLFPRIFCEIFPDTTGT